VKWVILFGIMLRIVGSPLSFVGSGRHSFMAAKYGSQHVGGCNPLLMVAAFELVKWGSNVANVIMPHIGLTMNL